MKVNSNRLYFTPDKENLIFRGGYARIRPLYEKPGGLLRGLAAQSSAKIMPSVFYYVFAEVSVHVDCLVAPRLEYPFCLCAAVHL